MTNRHPDRPDQKKLVTVNNFASFIEFLLNEWSLSPPSPCPVIYFVPTNPSAERSFVHFTIDSGIIIMVMVTTTKWLALSSAMLVLSGAEAALKEGESR